MINAKGLPANECLDLGGDHSGCWVEGDDLAKILIYSMESIPWPHGEPFRVCSYEFSEPPHPILMEVGMFE